MEPDIFIGREKPGELGSDHSNDIAEHGQENEPSVVRQDKTSTTGAPHGETKAVKGRQFRIRSL